MRYLLTLLLIITRINLPAQDNRWELMFEWGENKKYTSYYDTETIKYTDDNVEVWIRTNFNEPVFFDEKQIDHYLEKSRYYCNSTSMKTLEFIVYFIDGSYKIVLSESTEEKVITPESDGELFWQYFCQEKRF